MQTRSKTSSSRQAISNDFANLLGKPLEGKTLCVEDLRKMHKHIFDKYAVNGELKSISNELAKFLGKPVGSKMRRAEAVSNILSYIDNKNLLDADGATINPDRKLSALIKLGNNEKLTYFNLAKHITIHHIV